MSLHLEVLQNFMMNVESLRGEQSVSMRYLEVPYDQHASVAWIQVPFQSLKKLLQVTCEMKSAMTELLCFTQQPGAFKEGDFVSDIQPRCRKKIDELETVLEKCTF